MKRSKMLSILMTIFMLFTTVVNPNVIQTIFADDTSEDNIEKVKNDTKIDEKDGQEAVADLNDDEEEKDTDGGSSDTEQIIKTQEKEQKKEQEKPEKKQEVQSEDGEVEDNKGPPISLFSNGKDLGEDIFKNVTIKVNDPNGPDAVAPEIEIEPDTTIYVAYDWELPNNGIDGFQLEAGDFAKIKLPNVLKNIQGEGNGTFDFEGATVGTWTVDDGELTITFNGNDEFSANKIDRKGSIGFGIKFELNDFEDDHRQEIDLGTTGEKKFTLVMKPNKDKVEDIGKSGEANAKINPDYLEWIINVNATLEELSNAVVEDQIPAGLELDLDDVEIYELAVGANGKLTPGTKVTDKNVTIGEDNLLKVEIGETDKAYQIKYKTTIAEDGFQPAYTNKAVLKDGSDKKAEDTAIIGGLEQGTLIEKSGNHVGNNDFIDWTVDINKSEEELTDVKVLDTLPAGLKADFKSFQVFELTASGGSWIETPVTVEEGEDKFPYVLGNINGAYRIKFQTEIDYGYFDEYTEELDFINEAKLEVDGVIKDTDEDTVTVQRGSLLEKAGQDTTNYDGQKISWTVNVNQAKHHIKGAVITDTIGPGLKLDSDTIKVDGVKVTNTTNPADFPYLKTTSDNFFELHLGDITDAKTITYDTKIEGNIPEGKDKYENKVELTGTSGLTGGDIGIGKGEIEKTPGIKPNKFNSYIKNTVQNETIDSIHYDGLNYTKKTMSWKLTVDVLKEEITSLKITDSFLPEKSMKFLEDTLRVVGKDKEILVKDTHYTLVDKGVKGFELTFKDLSLNEPLAKGKYEIYFKTSFGPAEVLPEGEIPTSTREDGKFPDGLNYINNVAFKVKTKDVTGTETSEKTIEDDANYKVSTDYANHGLKRGKINREKREIKWEIFANVSGRDLTGSDFVITDVLTAGEQTVDINAIKIYKFEYNKGGTPQENTKEDVTNQFDITSHEEDGKPGFKATSKNKDVDYPVWVEFTSKITGKSEADYENIAKITDKTGVEKKYEASQKYERHDNFIEKKTDNATDKDEVYIDDVLDWEIKINESLSDLQGKLTVKDTMSQGLLLLENSIKVRDEEGNEKPFTFGVTEEDNNGETTLTITLNDIGEHRYFITYSTLVTQTHGDTISNSATFKAGEITGNSKPNESGNYKATLFSWSSAQGREDRGKIKLIKKNKDGKKESLKGAGFKVYYMVGSEQRWLADKEEDVEEGTTFYTDHNGELTIPNLHPSFDYYIKEVEAPNGFRLVDEAPEGYDDKINDEGYIKVDIKNTTPIEITFENKELVTIPVTKVWQDDDGTEEDRPEFIKVELKQNDTIIDTKEIKPTANGIWKHTFESNEEDDFYLDKYDADGNEYEYTISEIIDENHQMDYKTEINNENYTITNTRVGKIDVKGEKTWLDDDAKDRPEEITINLLANGDEVGEPKKVTKNDEWKYEFKDLEEFDEDGVRIKYTVKEVVPEGYEPDYTNTDEGYDITNLRTGTTEVSGEKKWITYGDIDYRPNSITVELSGEVDDNTIVTETKEISSATDWKYNFNDLAKYDSQGKEISYSVEEVDVPIGYESETTGYDIMNTQETIKVEGTKVWKDENETKDRPESITIEVLIEGTDKVVGSEEIPTDDNFTYKFDNLPKYDKSGEEIKYVINELNVPGYVADVKGYDITNTRTDKTDISVMKKWLDEYEEDRPESITVQLYQNEEKYEGAVTISAADNWKHTFEDLASFDDEGQPYVYTVQEINVDDKYTAGDPKWNADANGFEITNVRSGEKSIKITKNWDEVSSTFRPASIKVDLYRLVEGGKAQLVEDVDTIIEGAKDEKVWVLTIPDLPEFDEEGRKYTYSIEEEQVGGYLEPEIIGNETDGFEITNTQKTYAIGDYTWIDVNKDGIQDEDEPVLPGVIVELYDENGEKIAETTTDENGRYIFDELPAGKYQVKFVLTEEQAKKYEFTKQSVDKADDASTNDSDADRVTGFTTVIELGNNLVTKDYTDQEFKATEGIDPTWDAGVILREKIEITGQKTWDDAENQDGIRPESIVIHLLADGEKFDSREVTTEDDWTWTFEDLYKSEAGADTDIVYTIVEEAVENYTTKIEGYDVINKYTPEQRSVQITKAWKDSNNKDNKRPDNIQVKLFADGQDTGKTITLTAANNWTETFTELDVNKNGKPIKYTVEEIEIEGYDSEITGDMDNSFVITNTKKPIKVTSKSDDEDSIFKLPKTGESSYMWLALIAIVVGLAFITYDRKWNGKEE